MKFLSIIAILFSSLSYGNEFERYPRNIVHAETNINIFNKQKSEENNLAMQVSIDNKFSSKQRNLIMRALDVFLQRSLNDSVLDCAYRASYKDLPSSRDEFKRHLLEALSFVSIEKIQIPSFLFIASFVSERYFGIGYVGLFFDNEHPFPGFDHKHYLHIALNIKFINNPLRAYMTMPDYWAGVIAHEILHNLAYEHSSGYAGSFVNEYGKCITTFGGAFAISPGDEDNFDDLEIYK